MIPNEWRQIKEGAGDEVLVAIDFESGRVEPGFGDLARVLDIPFGIVQPTPPKVEFGPGFGASYLDEWVRLIRQNELKVSGVMGYCAGGTLACGLAARLGGLPVVVFDPDEVNGPTIFYHFMLAVQQFGDLLDQDDLNTVFDRVRELCRDPALTHVADRLPAEYETVASRAFAELEVDEENITELATRFAQFVHYLLACLDLGYGAAQGPVLAVISEGYQSPAGLRATIRTVAAAHAEFLTSGEVAEIVSEAFNR